MRVLGLVLRVLGLVLEWVGRVTVVVILTFSFPVGWLILWLWHRHNVNERRFELLEDQIQGRPGVTNRSLSGWLIVIGVVIVAIFVLAAIETPPVTAHGSAVAEQR